MKRWTLILMTGLPVIAGCDSAVWPANTATILGAQEAIFRLIDVLVDLIPPAV